MDKLMRSFVSTMLPNQEWFSVIVQYVGNAIFAFSVC
jgi:hypothetical protein